MTAKQDLEHSGTFEEHPFAELLVEIMHAKFSGSLRVSNDKQKVIVYFRSGSVVFAVSNSKALRLFNILLKWNKVDVKTISKYPNFANDTEFAASLIAAGLVTPEVINEAMIQQIEEIVVEVLTWPNGEWTFSPLVRVRDSLAFPIDIYGLLIDFARCASLEHVGQRFRSFEESFAVIDRDGSATALHAHESFVYDLIKGQPKKIDDLRAMSAMPEMGLFQALYVLWLGGLLSRSSWNSAFSATKVGDIRTARVARVKEAAEISLPKAEEVIETPVETVEEEAKPAPVEILITLDEFLKRTAAAETHYDIFAVEVDAPASEIKQIYFALAKMFHPDRFHRESAERLREIQTAFSSLANAYEILKNPDSRDAYNSKIYREIEAREKRKAAGQEVSNDPADRKAEQGLESFEQGLNHLNDEEYEAAAAYLARAVHYSPQNALFHAYYGRALASDKKQKHKAESELQTAAKLDQNSSKIRMMLVEFLLEMNQLKRAEGELKRFLELAPNDKDAIAMLAKISK